jgi:hypothetical protein
LNAELIGLQGSLCWFCVGIANNAFNERRPSVQRAPLLCGIIEGWERRKMARLTRVIMRPARTAMILLWMLDGLAGHAMALECPIPHVVTDKTAIRETPADISRLSNALEVDQTGNVTAEMVFGLRRRYPTASFAEIVNFMVTAYCPVVAGNASLDDEGKRNRLESYSREVQALAAQ